MHYTSDEIQKMKVIELRGELMSRNLDTKGLKAELVERLITAIQKEKTEGDAVPSATTNNGAGLNLSSVDQSKAPLNLSTSPRRETASPTKVAVPPVKAEQDQVSPVKQAVAPVGQVSPVKQAVAPVGQVSPVKQAVAPAHVGQVSPVKQAVAPAPVSQVSPVKQAVAPVSPTKTKPTQATNNSEGTTPPVKSASPAKAASPAKPEPVVEPAAQPAQPEVEQQAGEEEEENHDTTYEQSAPSQEVEKNQKEETENKNGEDLNEAAEAMETDDSKACKRKAEEVNGESAATEETEESQPKKIKNEVNVVEEDEPEFENKGIVLDWYQSDLNLKIDKENFLKGASVIFDEFPWAYCGAKATHGFTAGQLCYEVKYDENFSGRNTVGKEDVQHRLRVGWSDLKTELQLGEEAYSYGYDSDEGKFYNAGEIEDGGQPFTKGDIITAYLNLESDPIEIKFAKNGIILEKAITIPKADAEGKIWFPHILVRNASFEANFGGSEPSDEDALLEGFIMVEKVEPSETKIRGPVRASTRADCEFIMLCGLACAGKTCWAKDYKAANPEKNYLILGTSTVVERILKKGNAAAQRSHDVLLSKAGRFTEKLMELAATRRRNYILDQSNLLPSVQRRKTAGFEGFRRRAVVIIPPEEEYQNRIKAREQEQGKSVPKSTLLDMKAGYRLPEVGDIFTEVEFAGVSKEGAEELVKKYNKEGIDAGYGQRTIGGRGNRNNNRFPRGGRGGPGFGRGAPRGSTWRGGPPPSKRGFNRGGNIRGQPSTPARGFNPVNKFSPRGYTPPKPSFRGSSTGGNRGGFNPTRFESNYRGFATPSTAGTRGTGYQPRQLMSARMPADAAFQPQQRYFNSNRGNWSARGNTNVRGSVPRGRAPVGRGGANQFVNPWVQQVPDQGFGQSWDNSNRVSRDPWVQQVPDQGFGQSWDNSRSVGGMGVNRNSGGGGTWQGLGGQTYNSFGGGGRGVYRRN